VLALASAAGLSACGGSSSTDATASSAKPPPALTGGASQQLEGLTRAWRQGFEGSAGGEVSFRTLADGINLEPAASGKVEFEGIDAPITPTQYGKGPRPPEAMIPWALTGLAVVYNVKGAPSGLRLNRDVLGEIFLGKVTRWDDPAIAALNPRAHLPPTPIKPVLRKQESGEDYVFSDYLHVYRGSYRSTVGIGRTLVRLTHVGAAGASDVTKTVRGTNGAIAYMFLPSARAQHMAIAQIENPAGKFVAPTRAAVEAGAEQGSRLGPNNEVWLRELPASAASAYPLVTFNYAVVPSSFGIEPSPPTRQLGKFIAYALGPEGQAAALQAGFAALPPGVAAANARTMKDVFP
jgi:phosphate ABC transporter phosphate-binding protein